jgi:hypothetical protein
VSRPPKTGEPLLDRTVGPRVEAAEREDGVLTEGIVFARLEPLGRRST